MDERVDHLARLGTQLLDQTEAAAFLRLRPDTLATWRCTKAQRIEYVKIGRRVFYRRDALEAWLRTRIVDGDVIS